MTKQQLEYFVESVKYGSMSIAAEYLHVTPQAISKAIKSLEQELSCKLFERDNLGVSLTQLGEEFYSIANNILKQVNDFQFKINANKEYNQNTNKRCLKILCSNNFISLVNHVFFEFQKNNPDILLSVKAIAPMENNFDELMKEYDIVILCTSRLSELRGFFSDGNYDFFLLDQSNLRLFMSSESPYSGLKIISNRMLSKIPIIDYSENDEESELIKILRDYGIKPMVFARSNVPISFSEQINPDCYHFLATKLYIKTLNNRISSNLISIPLKTKVLLSYVMVVKVEAGNASNNDFANFLKVYFKNHMMKL